MCKIITVSNQKGGTGKTTSCVNLGIGLASEGKRVLLIDSDPQGSLSISLGYSEPDNFENTLATLSFIAMMFPTLLMISILVSNLILQ